MRRLLSLALLGLMTASCVKVGEVKVSPVKVPKTTVNVGEKNVEVIKAPLLVKKDNLNHDLGEEGERKLVVSFSGNLKDFCSYLEKRGVFCVVDNRVAFREFRVDGEYSLEGLLSLVARLTNSYWSKEGNIIRFRNDKVVVYELPFLTRGMLEKLYNISDKDSLQFKNSIYKEIEQGLKKILSYKVVKATLQESYEESDTYTQKRETTSEDTNKVKRLNLHSFDRSKTKSTERTASKESTERESTTSSYLNSSLEGEKVEKGRKRGKIPLTVVPLKTAKRENSTQKEGGKDKTVSTLSKGTTSNGKAIKDSRKLEKERERVIKGVNSYKGEGKEESKTTLKVETVFNGKEKFSVIKDLGLVVVRVDRDTEPLVDELMNSLVKDTLSNLVVFSVYIVELDWGKSKELTASLSLLKRAYRKEFNLGMQNDAVNVSFTSLSQDYLQGIATGVSLSWFMNYVTKKVKGKIISSSTLLALPKTMARIKSAIGIPYLEPQSVSVGGTNPTLSYSIKYLDDGMELRLVPTVIGDNLFVTLTAYLNQYLGDKTIQAGELGTFTLPIQSPKEITTTFRCRAGDVIFIGGLRKFVDTRVDRRNFLLSSGVRREKSLKELFVVVSPKLIKFVDNQIRR